jgi:hypothetical protein
MARSWSAKRVAGGQGAQTLRQREQALAAEAVAAKLGKAVGEDATAETGSEVVFDPEGNAVA